jgi:hypothetical protein
MNASPPLPDGYIAHLPPPKFVHRQPHIFGEAVTVPKKVSETGFEHKEKPCRNCGVVRVTLIGAEAHRARGWRSAVGEKLVVTNVEPMCPMVPMVTKEESK